MKHSIIAVALAVAMPSLAQAGTTGIFNGYARMDDGAPVASAVVQVYSATRRAMTNTDARGFFTFIDLPPDVYSVYVEKGVSSHVSLASVSHEVRINSDQTTFIVFQLAISRCPTSPSPSISADQSSQDFISLNLRQMSNYPLPLSRSIVPLPLQEVRPYHGCI